MALDVWKKKDDLDYVGCRSNVYSSQRRGKEKSMRIRFQTQSREWKMTICQEEGMWGSIFSDANRNVAVSDEMVIVKS